MERLSAATPWKMTMIQRFLGRHLSTALLGSIFILSCWNLEKVRIKLLTPLFKYTFNFEISNLEFIASMTLSAFRIENAFRIKTLSRWNVILIEVREKCESEIVGLFLRAAPFQCF